MPGQADDQVLIELIVDDSQLVSSADKLAELGVIDKKLAQSFKETNSALASRGATLKEIGGQMSVVAGENKKIKASFDDVNKAVDGFTQNFIEGFEEGVIAELKKAGVSTKDFNEALKSIGKEGAKSTDSLRTKMRELTNQMALLKSQGKDNTEQYKQLTREAGKLRDAIGDVNAEIRTAASDTRVFDGLISAATGVAGAFSVAQGAAALFGSEDKELQETLVKVQGALAILNGLQAIQNVLQKESAAAILANTIATKAQAAAQSVLTFVIGGTTGALKAFRIALAATGVGLLVLGLYELITALDSSEESMDEFNKTIEKNKELLEADIKAVEDRTEIELARLRSLGAAESELIKTKGRALQMQLALAQADNARLVSELNTVSKTSQAWFALNKSLEDNNAQQKALIKGITTAQFDLTKALKDEEKKRNDDAVSAAKERETKEKERLTKLKAQRLSEFEDFKASLELRLLAVQKGSDEELELKKRIALASLQIDLENDKLTENQRKLAIQRFFEERLQLEKDFGAEQRKLALENISSDLNASLQAAEISNEEKLELTISSLQVQAALEIEAANGNASKIREIEAKRDKDIRDARVQSIKDTLNYELELYNVQNAAILRAQQKIANDQKNPLASRIEAINKATDIQLTAINKELDALNKQRQQKLISEKEYLLEYSKIQDKKTQIVEDSETKISDIVKQEEEKRKEATRQRVQTAIDLAQTVVQVYSAFVQNTNERENNAIAEKKTALQELKENGAITEKEYRLRLKKIEAEEKRVRREQAEREKRVAVFNAFLAIPQAFLKGLTQGGLILAGIYAGLATLQAVAVASRPLPKFALGTKYAPSGDAIVAEDRPEIVESKGVRTLYNKKQIVRLSQGDIVYNAFETQRLLQKDVPNVSKEIINGYEINNGVAIDYEMLGRVLARNIPEQKETGFIWDEHGVTKWTQQGNSRTIYHNKRYGQK